MTGLIFIVMAESRKCFKAIFERGEYRVVTAHDEENAATVSRIFPPDLILISSEIPPSDYFDVAHRIRRSLGKAYCQFKLARQGLYVRLSPATHLDVWHMC
jgi:DNA-binding response OmpR family regulator